MNRHSKSIANGMLKIALLALSGTLLCAAAQQPTDAQNPGSLLITLREFTLGATPPSLNHSNCINVWADGRFHLERRWQQSTGGAAQVLVFNSTLPKTQFHELKQLLDSEALRQLPETFVPDPSVAKTWLSGVQVWITRDGSIQRAGYFEWGEHEPANEAHPARNFVRQSHPEASSALKPLEGWLQHVNSERLSPGGAESTMCNANPEN